MDQHVRDLGEIPPCEKGGEMTTVNVIIIVLFLPSPDLTMLLNWTFSPSSMVEPERTRLA